MLVLNFIHAVDGKALRDRFGVSFHKETFLVLMEKGIQLYSGYRTRRPRFCPPKIWHIYGGYGRKKAVLPHMYGYSIFKSLVVVQKRLNALQVSPQYARPSRCYL